MARSLLTLRDVPLTQVNGLGPKKAQGLRSLGIDNVYDLVTHYPRRYIDRTRDATVADLAPGDEGAVLARVTAVSARRVGGGRMMVSLTAHDRTGSMTVSFFNQAWREQQLPVGTEAVFFGKMGEFRGRPQMTNPVVDLVGDRTGRLIPVYPQSDKARITSWDLTGWIAQCLRRAGTLDDPVPRPVRERFGLVDRNTAITGIHEPETMEHAMAARARLVFDELLRVQLALVVRKRELEAHSVGIAHSPSRRQVERLHAGLPFPLTEAQIRTIDEILADMSAPSPMHRLLQGDVGAGKTLVAASAMVAAVEGGHQSALMAPTEVLAEQHVAGLAALFEDFTVGEEAALFDRPLRVELLTNRIPSAARRRITTDLAAGLVDIVVGTHALLSEDVAFRSLGLVVIDEQHRFGVEQRAALRDKGRGAVPDVLVMTATPIPRTAAMTVYGDLDVSVLDELPPGRTPVRTTRARTEPEIDAVWADVRARVERGEQAYVVCPLVEDSEKLEVASATETFERLRAVELAGMRVGLIHGRVRSEEKAEVMGAFRTGDLDVLVATTVIEVGVDVPNATVMVVLDADRFGIAQLHQLRGRVGRGSVSSTCHLVTGTKGGGDGETPMPDPDEAGDADERLDALVRTNDGFELAEIDLGLRGEGTIMGARQKGMNELKLASLRRDRTWVERAREVAFELVDAGLPDALAAELDLLVDPEEQDYLLKN